MKFDKFQRAIRFIFISFTPFQYSGGWFKKCNSKSGKLHAFFPYIPLERETDKILFKLESRLTNCASSMGSSSIVFITSSEMSHISDWSKSVFALFLEFFNNSSQNYVFEGLHFVHAHSKLFLNPHIFIGQSSGLEMEILISKLKCNTIYRR